MLRWTKRIFPSLALVVLAAAVFHAEGGTRFTATSAGVSGAGEGIKINVSNWSSDSVRDEFVAAWTLTAAAPQGRGGRGGGAGAAGRGAGGATGGAGGGAARGGAAARGGRGGGDATA